MTETLHPPVNASDHRLGATADGGVVITVFGDYECPYSRRLDRLVREDLVGAHTGKVAYVFRHFPLHKIHPRALDAALAAEAAGAQGSFWDMHALLYEHQRDLDRSVLMELAVRLDLDRARFARDLDKRVHLDRVRDNMRSGAGSGVRATPTAFVNGQRWELQRLDEIVPDVEHLLTAQ